MIRSALRPMLWCTVLLLSLSAARATPGTITGQVTHVTEHTAIPDAAVWAEPVGAMPTFPPPAQPKPDGSTNAAKLPDPQPPSRQKPLLSEIRLSSEAKLQHHSAYSVLETRSPSTEAAKTDAAPVGM